MNLSEGRLAPVPGADGLVTRMPGAVLFVAARTPADQVRRLAAVVTAHADATPARGLARELAALVAGDDDGVPARLRPGRRLRRRHLRPGLRRRRGPPPGRRDGDEVLTGVGSFTGVDREVAGPFHTIAVQPAGDPVPAPVFDVDVQAAARPPATGSRSPTLGSPTARIAPRRHVAAVERPPRPRNPSRRRSRTRRPPAARARARSPRRPTVAAMRVAPTSAPEPEPTAPPAPRHRRAAARRRRRPASTPRPRRGRRRPPTSTPTTWPRRRRRRPPRPRGRGCCRSTAPRTTLPPVADAPSTYQPPALDKAPAAAAPGTPTPAPAPAGDAPRRRPRPRPAHPVRRPCPVADRTCRPTGPAAEAAPPAYEAATVAVTPADRRPPAAAARLRPRRPPGYFTSQLLGALDDDEAEEREALPVELDPAEVRQADQVTSEVLVQGVICSRGHFNDPRSRFCSSCGISMVQNTQVLTNGPRPPLGVMVFEDGATFSLSSDYVVGRQPEVSELVQQGLALPLPVDDPERSISRRPRRAPARRLGRPPGQPVGHQRLVRVGRERPAVGPDPRGPVGRCSPPACAWPSAAAPPSSSPASSAEGRRLLGDVVRVPTDVRRVLAPRP